MALGYKTGGRKKGTPNKATASVKQALQIAFDGIGGVERLTEWAMNNQTEFYKLYSKLLPQEISGPDGGAIPIEATVKFVGAASQP